MIAIACYNYTLDKGKILDGGSIWLNNIRKALELEGHKVKFVGLDTKIKADVLIIQSEWVGTEVYTTFKGRKIVLLGHFIKAAYPDPKEIQAELFTTWKGELLEGFKTTFFPHACPNVESEQIDKGTVVWCGNTYALRDEGWLNGIDVSRLSNISTSELTGAYRGSVCPNIYGKFQLGEISNEPSRIADKSGYMINERFWHVIGAGGILIDMYNPQVFEFFNEDEIIFAKTKEEFQAKITYYRDHLEEGIEFYQRARDKVLKEHTYLNRIKLLNL